MEHTEWFCVSNFFLIPIKELGTFIKKLLKIHRSVLFEYEDRSYMNIPWTGTIVQ